MSAFVCRRWQLYPRSQGRSRHEIPASSHTRASAGDWIDRVLLRHGVAEQRHQPVAELLGDLAAHIHDSDRLLDHAAEYAATRADEAHFLPEGHLPIIITREHVVL
jgi:hypothetical protein